MEIGSGTLNLQGEYQTMLGQGGILQQQPMSGRVYIGITIVPDDFYTGFSICSTTLSADLLASFVTVEQRGDAEVAGRNITDQSFSRKNITLRVRPGRSGVSLLMPSRWEGGGVGANVAQHTVEHRAVYKSTSEIGTLLCTQDSQLGPNGVL